jgi:hypothetical protein
VKWGVVGPEWVPVKYRLGSLPASRHTDARRRAAGNTLKSRASYFGAAPGVQPAAPAKTLAFWRWPARASATEASQASQPPSANHAKTADLRLLHSPREVDELLSQASRLHLTKAIGTPGVRTLLIETAAETILHAAGEGTASTLATALPRARR